MAGTRVNGIRSLKLAMLPGRKSVLVRALLIYAAIGSLLIAMLSLILYQRFSVNSIQEINKVSTDSLKESMVTFDRLWNTLYLYMNKEFQTDATLLEGMGLKEYNPMDSSKVGAALNEIVNTNDMIDSVYLYNANADIVFSNYGTATSSSAFYDQGMMNLITGRSISISQISGCDILYRKMHYAYGSLDVTKNAITVVFSSDDMRTALIFNIDQNLLQSLIVPDDSPADQNILIINRQGVVISDSEPSKIFTTISNMGYIKKILASPVASGDFIDTVNAKKSLVTYSVWNKWGTLGWVFVKTAGYDGLLGDLKQLQASVLVITLLFILAAITAAVLFWGNLFSPFYRLIELMRSRNPYEPAKRSEIEYLGDVYGSLVEDIDSLNSYKNSSGPLLRQEFLYRLVHGETARGADAVKLASSLGIRLDAARYRVVTLRLDKDCESDPQDKALLKYTACGIAAQSFAAFGGEVLESGEDSISAILCLRKDDVPLVQAIRSVQEACLKLLKLSFTAGIGAVEDGVQGIQFSFRTAMEATSYRLVYGRGSIIDYTAEAVTRQKKYIYPLDLERELTDAAKATDSARFSTALSVFASEIEGYAYNEILLALSQMSIILIRTLKSQLEVTHMQEVGIEADVWEVDSAIRTSETMGDIKMWLNAYFERCMEAVRTHRNCRYTDVINSIYAYINENYGDATMTVDRIAGHVSLSPNYMRSLFKDHTGMTVSHYLNELRFAKAGELLVSTGHPASRIAGMVGFPEGTYFYSAFKNAKGMTPDEFRKKYKTS